MLEANLEAILIALDVGALNKVWSVWWAALLANLEHCGMAGRSLRLMESYLCARLLMAPVRVEDFSASLCRVAIRRRCRVAYKLLRY